MLPRPLIGRVGAALWTPVRRLARGWSSTRRTLASIPDVVDAILVLPHQLEVVAFQTATLADMREELARIHGDTAALPRMNETLERMAILLDRVDGNTAGVEQLAQVMLPLQGAAVRVGRAADRWPGRRAAALRPPPGGPRP